MVSLPADRFVGTWPKEGGGVEPQGGGEWDCESGPSPSRGQVILFPRADRAELAAPGSPFPLIPSGGGPGWGG